MGTQQQDRRDVGARVREAMAARFGGDRTQAAVAADLNLSPDAFSRSLNGDRAFTTAELARAADLFAADLHHLITGRPDPLRAVVAARHDYDPETNQYSNAGAERDKATRDGVLLAYRQANPWLTASDVELPATATGCREVLFGGDAGDDGGVEASVGFVRAFADRVEYSLGVDVVRLPGLTTDYSMTLGDQKIVLLKTAANWFRSNWSLAHELGHLCLGHHDVDGTHADTRAEREANAFAAELLLPTEEMQTVAWDSASPAEVAGFVWEAGVSTTTLKNRLTTLRLTVPADVAVYLDAPTQRLLRHHPVDATRPRAVEGRSHHFVTVHDPIDDRMSRSAERRVPARLMKALRDGIETGRLNPGTLGWLLDVDTDTLELDRPEPQPDISADELLDRLGL